MKTTRAFNDPAYLALEAERLGGRPELISIKDQDQIGLISRSIPGTDYIDYVSVYGYPEFTLSNTPKIKATLGSCINDLTRIARERQGVAGFMRLGLNQNIKNFPKESDCYKLEPLGEVVVVNLQRPAEEILSSYRKQVRYELRQPHEISVEATDDVPAFHAIYTENMTRLDARQDYFFSEEYLRQLCKIDGVELVLAKGADGPAAGAILMAHGNDLYYHLGATATRALAKSPLKQLLHSVIMKYAGGQYNRMVLGGGLGGEADSLLRFKRGFSKEMHSVYALKIIFNTEIYDTLSGGADETERFKGFFPTYREVPKVNPN